MIYDLGGRLRFHPITDSLDHAYLVCQWRNTDAARAAFYDRRVVTPDTHIALMRERKPHDLIWLIEAFGTGFVGMTSLTIDVERGTAEYGRAFIDPRHTGKGYGLEQEYMVLTMAFELFNLQSLWGDVLAENEAARALHQKTGWTDVGIDVPGHMNKRGPVLHIAYKRETWQEHRQKFIERFHVTLPGWAG